MDSSPRLHLLPLLLAVLLAAAAAAPGVIRMRSAGKAAEACAAPPDPAVYDRPVIGIVSHPGDGAGGRISNGTATSYIGASYVKFVEAAGARVVPLVYNDPEERILEKLSLLNGVLFTGGSVKRGPYFETVKKVFQYALDKNDAGEPFAVFAQCLGFELVSMIVSKDNNILETFDAVNQASTLQFPSYSLIQGSVFERFDPDLIKKVSTSCLVMQNHKYGISPKRLRENDALSSFFKVLTTSPDENGKVYVSTVQAHKYPITCTQWHPEKAIFEWRKPMIPHSEYAVQVTQHFANHFIRFLTVTFYLGMSKLRLLHLSIVDPTINLFRSVMEIISQIDKNPILVTFSLCLCRSTEPQSVVLLFFLSTCVVSFLLIKTMLLAQENWHIILTLKKIYFTNVNQTFCFL